MSPKKKRRNASSSDQGKASSDQGNAGSDQGNAGNSDQGKASSDQRNANSLALNSKTSARAKRLENRNKKKEATNKKKKNQIVIVNRGPDDDKQKDPDYVPQDDDILIVDRGRSESDNDADEDYDTDEELFDDPVDSILASYPLFVVRVGCFKLGQVPSCRLGSRLGFLAKLLLVDFSYDPLIHLVHVVEGRLKIRFLVHLLERLQIIFYF